MHRIQQGSPILNNVLFCIYHPHTTSKFCIKLYMEILTGAPIVTYTNVTYTANSRNRKRNILLTVQPGFLRLLLYLKTLFRYLLRKMQTSKCMRHCNGRTFQVHNFLSKTSYINKTVKAPKSIKVVITMNVLMT